MMIRRSLRSVLMASILLCAWNLQAYAFDISPDVRDAIRGRDYERAATLLRRQAKGGDADAHYQLGSMYRTGQGVGKNSQKAFQHFSVAAEKGHSAAQYNLGLLYETGHGTEEDLKQAQVWLSRAAEAGHSRAIARLTKAPYLPNSSQSKDARTVAAFCLGVERGKAKDIERVIQGGLSPNSIQCDKRTPLELAVRGGHLDVVHALARTGADANHLTEAGLTPLMIAAARGHDKVGAFLAQQTTTLDARDKEGNTAVHFAAMRGLALTLTVLIDRGSNLNLENHATKTPLDIAVSRSNKSVTGLLKAAGAQRGQASSLLVRRNKARGLPDKTSGLFAGWPELHLSAWKGEADLVAAMIDKGVPLNVTDAKGFTALGRAVLAGQAVVVGQLLEAGASCGDDLEASTNEIFLAAAAKDANLLKLFYPHLSARATSLRRPDRALGLLLHQERTEDAGKLLLLSSGYVSSNTAREHAGLAAGLDNLALLKALAREGGGVGAVFAQDRTLLQRAVTAGREENVAWLLQQGAEVNGVSTEGNTALHLAAGQGRVNVVRILVEGGADLNLKNHRGNTPLAIAAMAAQTGTATMLLEAGANPILPNKKKERPEALVPATHPELAALIRSYRKKRNWFLEAL